MAKRTAPAKPMFQNWWIAAALAAVVLAIYARISGFQFIAFDDGLYVFSNPHVRNGLTLDGLLWAFRTWDYIYWQPLAFASHMLDVQLFGMDAGAHHATSAVLHAANSALLFLVLVRLTGARWRSALVAALFAFHPLRVESVAWVAERKDVLSGLFAILTLWAYAEYCRKTQSLARYAALVGCYALGLMSKPMVVTLPFLLLLLDEWPLARREPLVRRIIEKLPLFGMVGIVSVVTYLGQKKYGALSELEGLGAARHLANAVTSYVHYLSKTLWPQPLAAFYPYRKDIPAAEIVASVVLLAMVSTAAFWFRRRRPYVFVGWFWFLGLLVPTIGIVQAGAQSMADRFSYLPSIGLFVGLVWLGAEEIEARHLNARTVARALIALLAVLAITSWSQTDYWRDSVTLFQHAVDVTTNNAVAQLNLGFVLETRGDNQAAVPHLREALRLEPKYFQAHYDLGKALAALGQSEEALGCFDRTVAIKPDYGDAHYGRAMMLHTLGRDSEAEPAFRMALARTLMPEYAAEAHNALGVLLGQRGDLAGAATEFQRALEIRPDHAGARRNLALARGVKPR